MLRTLIPIVFLLLAMALFLTQTQPMIGEIKVLQIEDKQLDDALVNSKKLEESWNTLETQYAQYTQSDEDKLEIFLPGNIDNVKLIIEVDNLARQKNLELLSANTLNTVNKKEESQEVYGTVSMEVGIEGAYENFVDFLEQLEKSLRIIDIKIVVFDNVDKRKLTENELGDIQSLGIPSYNYQVSFSTYWLK